MIYERIFPMSKWNSDADSGMILFLSWLVSLRFEGQRSTDLVPAFFCQLCLFFALFSPSSLITPLYYFVSELRSSVWQQVPRLASSLCICLLGL